MPRFEAKVEHSLDRTMPVSQAINGWESSWALKSYRARNPSKLSQFSLDRLAEAEKMTQDIYRERLAEREAIRALYATLATEVDATRSITLAASRGPAPLGMRRNYRRSCPAWSPAPALGVPVISPPVLAVDGLPVGLQLMGFLDADAASGSRRRCN